ncbi:PilT/PilU family type 4a pilus ATPase [Candidatus Sumerlaeota bacterium]|nr:PilT/PilU family type 4a pilus ATPase [Candidatus Sumerlaeota bacterium]
MVKLEVLLREMVDRNASDLFLRVGARPMLRIDGIIHPTDFPQLSVQDTQTVAYSLMTDQQKKQFEQNPEMDLAIGIKDVGRFRVNIYRQRGTIGIVFRYVRRPDLSFEELNLPPAVRTLAEMPRGLILVTGTTGSGKSTTIAAMINHINQIRNCHIVTIEDPIEFLHEDRQAVISQREVGFDTSSFSEALRHIMRQSPDVILIGEMRDLETVSAAISAAITGHLVFSTLHTIDAVSTVERIINFFPTYLQHQIRLDLSVCLAGVISQRLLPRSEGKGRVPAVEIMITTPTIRKLIFEGKLLEIQGYIESGGHVGMQTFNQSLYDLYQRGFISYDDAIGYASSPDEFRLLVEGIASGTQDKKPTTSGR